MNKYLLSVIAFAAVVRILVYNVYVPTVGGDTQGYQQLMEMLGHFDFNEYDAWRTPGYPLFLLLCRSNFQLITYIQAILGILAIVILCHILMGLSGTKYMVLIYGLFLSCSLNFITLERTILTEALTLFLFTWVVLFLYNLENRQSAWKTLFWGGIVAFLVLTRPQYLVAIPICALAIAYAANLPFRFRLKQVVYFLLSACLPLVMWILFNFIQVGQFVLTTTIGLNLTNHTLPFIEYAEEADNLHIIPQLTQIREQYWQYAQQLDDNRAFIPRPNFDMTRVQASRYYVRLSFAAIQNAPGQYFKSVFKAWTRFWRVSFICDGNSLTKPQMESVFQAIWIPQKIIWLLLNVLFLLSIPYVGIECIQRRKITWYAWIMILVLSVSVFQAFLEYGDNSRYATPIQPTIGMLAVYLIGRCKNLSMYKNRS